MGDYMKTDTAQIDDLFADIGKRVDNNQQLNWSMSIRKQLVEEYLLDDTGRVRKTSDVKEGALVSKLLSDMDKISLQRERITSDEKNMTSFAEIAKSLHENREAILGNTEEFGDIVEHAGNQLDESRIPVFEYHEGENEISAPAMDWRSFAAEHEAKVNAPK